MHLVVYALPPPFRFNSLFIPSSQQLAPQFMEYETLRITLYKCKNTLDFSHIKFQPTQNYFCALPIPPAPSTPTPMKVSEYQRYVTHKFKTFKGLYIFTELQARFASETTKIIVRIKHFKLGKQRYLPHN